MATFDNTYYRVELLNKYVQISQYGFPSGEIKEVLIEQYLFAPTSVTRVIFDEAQQFGLQILFNPNRESFFFDSEGLSLQIFIDGANGIPFTYETLKEFLTASTSN